MIPLFPTELVTVPVAHRALHDVAHERPENSRAAIQAAIEKGYGIETDLQLSADGQAMVFHDYDLSRLTDESGPIRKRTAAEASAIALKHGDGETIPTLRDVLELVEGRVPLLIEIKDQDGGMGPDVGPLEAATAAALKSYNGPAAVMSYNPHSIMQMAKLAPGLARGLVTCMYDPPEWPLSNETCRRLREIPDFEACKASFISHNKDDLERPRVMELRDRGVPVLCYTIRSEVEEEWARRFADNVTFEHYLAKLPA